MSENRSNKLYETGTEKAEQSDKNRLSGSKVPNVSNSSAVLRGEDADQTLHLAFGEQESELDKALRESLGLNKNKDRNEMPQDQQKSGLRSVLNFFLTLAVCVGIAFLLTQFVVQRNTVIGHSMVPTLDEKDELFVEKISHYWLGYTRGELITAKTDEYSQDGKRMIVIKRIIALPGETIEIKDKKVYIDGNLLDEPYLPDGTETIPSGAADSFSLSLNAGEYFLMGDNRGDSFDSRHFGVITEDRILGRVWIRFYPFDKIGKP